uniref:RNA helicase n=1 Tax=Strongyloides papillosus TaxID=174720 RepID=A0A0N5BJK0_STREA
MSKVTEKDIRTLGEKLNDLKTGGDEVIINIERDEELFQDMKALYNWLEILLPNYDFSKNELPAEKFFKINPPTDVCIDKNIQHKIHTYAGENGGIKKFIANWSPPKINYNCWTNMFIADGMFKDKPVEEISGSLRDVDSRKMKDAVMEDLRRKLPVYEKKNEIIKAVEENDVLLIKAGTGSGKSTQVGQILLKHYISQGRGGEFNCIITQPRRLAAISLAKRVAEERYEKLGESVGYCVRFDKVDPRPFGSIVFGTVGTILRKLSSGFRGVSHIIVDEVHERSLETDLLLIFLKKMILNGCKIKIILMSATVGTQTFEDYISGIKVLEITGKVFKIYETYLDEIIQHFEAIPSNFVPPVDYVTNSKFWSFKNKSNKSFVSPLAEYIAEQIEQSDEIPYEIIRNLVLMAREAMIESGKFGSVLIFLPGWKEISKCIKELEKISNEYYWLVPLHSNLSSEDQKKAFELPPADKIKIIVSTNVAESSLTIDDVIYVIDSCRQKTGRLSQKRDKCFYEISWLSRDRMDQRKGRVGRIRSGHCCRLITKKFMNSLPQHSEPEIINCPLDSSILTIKALGLGDSKTFLQDAMEKIDEININEAENNLQEIDALDGNKNLTHTGRILEILPFAPNTGKCILTGLLFNVLDSLSIICTYCDSNASLFNDPFKQVETSKATMELCGDFKSDFILPLMAVQINTGCFKKSVKDLSLSKMLSKESKDRLLKAKKQTGDILHRMFQHNDFRDTGLPSNKESSVEMYTISSLLVKAVFPNIAVRDNKYKFIDNEGTIVLPVENSALTIFRNLYDPESMFILYWQKIISNRRKIKECQAISPMQALLFGYKQFVYIGSSKIKVDDNVIFRGDPKFIQMVISLNSLVDDLLKSLCIKKYLNEKEMTAKAYIKNLIQRISITGCSTNRYKWPRKIVTGLTKVDFRKIGGLTNW